MVGIGFFVFKINDLFNKLKDSAKEQITVIQQPVKNVPVESDENKKKKERFRLDLGKGKKINYKEVDSLIKTNPDINIATDVLLSSKTIKVIRLNEVLSGSDSAASVLAGVKPNMLDLYQVEFWKTPLNARGYRFSRNKVMLYGFVRL